MPLTCFRRRRQRRHFAAAAMPPLPPAPRRDDAEVFDAAIDYYYAITLFTPVFAIAIDFADAIDFRLCRLIRFRHFLSLRLIDLLIITPSSAFIAS